MAKKICASKWEAITWAGECPIAWERMGMFVGMDESGNVMAQMAWKPRHDTKVYLQRAPIAWSSSETVRQRLGLDPPGIGSRCRKGGSTTTERKAEAARANGLKGGTRLSCAPVPEGEKMNRQVIYLTTSALQMLRAHGQGKMSAYVEKLIRDDNTAAKKWENTQAIMKMKMPAMNGDAVIVETGESAT